MLLECENKIKFANMNDNLEIIQFSPDDLPENLVKYTTSHIFKTGQVLFYKEHVPYGLFILRNGSVEINNGKSSFEVNRPALLGYSTYLNQSPYKMTAVAKSKCNVFFISSTSFDQINKYEKRVAKWLKKLK